VSERQFDFDCVFVGGGLANCLLAYWYKQKSPQLKIIILEKNDFLGGNHTWSFHEKDLTPKEFKFIEPFVSKKWKGYSVAFPKHNRELSTAYYSVRSEELNEKVKNLVDVEFGVDIVGVAPHNVTALGGKQWSSQMVFDGRGFLPFDEQMVGFQKFVGMELELESHHGLSRPILMDSTVEQKDGFRFFYCLPWDETRILVEDTRYSENSHLDISEYREEIKRYCAQKNWKIRKVNREEVGALPIPLRAKYLPSNKGFPESWVQRLVPCVGVRGGFFHSTTGYSLPDTVRVVRRLMEVENKYEVIFPVMVKLAHSTASRQWFFRLLNRMMFIGSTPQNRYKILEFFYRMPKGLINRFYSGRMWPTDYIRIFLGRPPIKVKDALKCILHNREQANAT